MFVYYVAYVLIKFVEQFVHSRFYVTGTDLNFYSAAFLKNIWGVFTAVIIKTTTWKIIRSFAVAVPEFCCLRRILFRSLSRERSSFFSNLNICQWFAENICHIRNMYVYGETVYYLLREDFSNQLPRYRFKWDWNSVPIYYYSFIVFSIRRKEWAQWARCV